MLDDPLRIVTRLIDFDEKRIHYIHLMYHGEKGFLAATNELISLHVSLETRRATPISEQILLRLATVEGEQAGLPTPPQAGRSIGLGAKPNSESDPNRPTPPV